MIEHLKNKIIKTIGLEGNIDSNKLIESFDDELLGNFINYDWSVNASDEQVLPDWNSWETAIFTGKRKTGKTFVGAQSVRLAVEEHGFKKIAIIANSSNHFNNIMFYGDSGIHTLSPPWFKPVYIHSKSEVHWPNGAKAKVHYSENPESLRGTLNEFIWWDNCSSLSELKIIVFIGYCYLSLRGGQKGVSPKIILTSDFGNSCFLSNLNKKEGIFHSDLSGIVENSPHCKNHELIKFLEKQIESLKNE